MVVEHVFITTLDAPDALRVASEFLTRRGFEARAQQAFAVGGGGGAGGGDAWNVLEMSRGRANPRRAKSVVEYPQTLRLEWDRGRVTVAASSLSYQESRSDYFGRRRKGKVPQYQQQVLMGIVTHLQELLETRADPEHVAFRLAAQELEIHETDRRRQRRNVWIGVTVLVLFVAALVAIGIAAANSR